MNNPASYNQLVGERYRALAAAQKPPRHVPAYTRYINRSLARFVAAICPDWISPTGLTFAGTLLSYVGLGLVWILPPGTVWLTGVGVLLLIAFMLDSADGQLARLRKATSVFGEWIDHTLDAGKMAFVHLTAAVFVTRISDEPSRVLFALVAGYLVANSMNYAGMLLAEKLRGKVLRDEPGSASWHRSVLMLPIDYGLLCALFLLTPWSTGFIAGYVMLSVCNIAYCLAYVVKVGRDMHRIDVAQGESF